MINEQVPYDPRMPLATDGDNVFLRLKARYDIGDMKRKYVTSALLGDIDGLVYIALHELYRDDIQNAIQIRNGLIRARVNVADAICGAQLPVLSGVTQHLLNIAANNEYVRYIRVLLSIITERGPYYIPDIVRDKPARVRYVMLSCGLNDERVFSAKAAKKN